MEDGDPGPVNPFIGWVFWADSLPAENGPHSMAYVGIDWRSLEAQKNIYDFASIESDNRFLYCRDNGIRLILRVILDYPGKKDGIQIPQWLYDETGGDGTWYENDSGKRGYSPNYENPILIEAHRRMIEAIGQRYGRDPLIAFIQLGSLGQYGEWYVPAQAGRMPSAAVTAQYVQHYRTAFPDKVLLFRRPVSQMRGMTAGLYNDMIGDVKQTQRWLDWIVMGSDTEFQDMAAMPDFWRKGPSGGEFANGDPYRYLTDEYFDTTRQQIVDSHTSLIGPCAPDRRISAEVKANADRLLSLMGYRYQIQTAEMPRTAKAGSSVTIRQQWQNLGNSPLYYRWPVQVQLRQAQSQTPASGPDSSASDVGRTDVETVSGMADADTREWLPGPIQFDVTIQLPADMQPGSYELLTAIIDPDTGRPGISLANAGRRPDGYYRIGQIQIR